MAIYGAATPLLNGAKESKIEDFFDASTKAIAVSGKLFIDKNDFDVTKYYGKKVFAHQVVRVKADSINFGGFRPLLNNLVAVITAHSAAVSEVPAQQGA